MAATGAQYLARALDSYGVRAVFLVPTILSRTLYEIERSTDINRIVTHGEKAAAYMADGYARAGGGPGVCMAQTVGAANLAAGLKDAFLGCSPVVALTGGPSEISRSRNYYQETEDLPLFKPFTKFSAAVHHVSRLPDLLAHAFHAAQVGTRRPTHLELAGHTGDDIENAEFETEPPTDYLRPVPMVRSGAEPAAIAAAVAVLAAAERPVIVAGGGVRAAGAGPELLALAERLGILVATSLNGKDTVVGDHPLNVGVPGLYARQSANQVLLEADLVCYIGSQTGSQVTLFWQTPPPSTPVIHLDIEPTEFGRHYPNTTPLLGDAKVVLGQLLAATHPRTSGDRAAWTQRGRRIVAAWREANKDVVASDAVPIRPERLCAELSRTLPADAVLLSDTGHAGMWTGGFVDLTQPTQSYARAAGSLGWGLPASIGAQLAVPDRPVVLFTGDGGFWYHVAELETAARWGIPVTIVVNNNRSLNQEIPPYTAAYGGTLHGRHGELWRFADLDLARVAEAHGATGITVRQAGEFPSALDRALSTNGPTVVNVVTDSEIVAPPGTTEPAGGVR
ncbi:MAG TPA: thiamine pyrophosphate-binding protein [Pseudonocardiaceae bacterium]|nr:thiamine pyrophosphate-binding protein [Pseudonocardiaceae bacterium]